jgi:hypothetical protein
MNIAICQIIVEVVLTSEECALIPFDSCQSLTKFLGINGVNVLGIRTSFATGSTTIKLALPSLTCFPEMVKVLMLQSK